MPGQRHLSTVLSGFAAVLGAVAALSSCTPPETPPPPPPRLPAFEPHQAGVQLPDGLVTTGIGQTCVPCHAEIVEAYGTSAMHDSLLLPGGEGTVESRYVGRTIVDRETGITTRFGAADGHYTQSLVYIDPQGVERARYDARVDLIVGSGHATRSYFQVKGGRLFELNLTWYRDLDDLALSPGPGFRSIALRNGTRLCVACHTGLVQPVSADADLGFRGKISLGIDCDRCHGDAELHVLTGDPTQSVNPAKLDEERQAELCYQCHLSSALTVEREGRTIAAYRPGQDLGEWLGVLLPANVDPAAGVTISSHAERMRLSACYSGSHAGGSDTPLTCTTCHNPHRGHLDRDERAAADRGCLVCHVEDDCHAAADDRAGSACFTCHMPRVSSRDIGHTRITDHFIQRRPPADLRPAPMHHPGELAVDGILLADHLDLDDTSPLRHIYDARAYLRGVEFAAVLLQSEAPVWADRALRALDAHERENGADSESKATRGRLLTLLNDPASAIPLLTAARDARPELPQRHANLAYALEDLGRFDDAIVALQRALQIDPFDEQIASTLARLLERGQRGAEALDLLEAVRENAGPSLQRAAQARGIALGLGDARRALAHTYDVLMFLPRNPDALYDAADLCRAIDGDRSRSGPLLEEALRNDPDHLPTLVALAESLISTDFQRARELVERAARIAPGAPAVQELIRRVR